MNSYFPLWLIAALPLLGAILNGALSLAGARSANGPSKGFVSLIAVACPGLSFAFTLAAASHLSATAPMSQSLWTWFSAGGFHLDFTLLFDRLTSMMLLFVTGIGTLIHLYSVGYMWNDRGFARFMAYMNLFMFSMIMLVLGGNLPVTFMGWEGVGLCSYLLIGFWHHNTEYNDAARKAFVMNRIGDLGFLLGAFALVQVCGSLDYLDIRGWFHNAPGGDAMSPSTHGWIKAAALLIFLGCTGKSAQIPLLTWLPDAMAGPTPVSALIHAATMVTSGVYLVARLGDLYSFVPEVLSVILVIGCLTAIFGAVAGLFQNDIKKALAYSTVSQLGFMFMACGVGAYDVALFHVFTHAFFKATLFLGAGAIIHGLHHEQDMRRMGGLHKLKGMFVAYMVLCFGWYAILGLPGGSGFVSKDLILERLWHGHAALTIGSSHVDIAQIVAVAALITALITAIYMTRVMMLTFWSPSRLSDEAKHHVEGTPFTMALPLIILGAGSMGAGYLWFEPMRLDIFYEYLKPVLHPNEMAAAGGLAPGMEGATVVQTDWLVTFMATVGCIAGLLIAVVVWRKGPTGKSAEAHPSSDPTGFGASWTWAFDRIYHVLVVLPTRWASLILYWLVEQALIGGITYAIAELTAYLGDGYATIQRSRLRTSLVLSVAGAAAILWIHPITDGIRYASSALSHILSLLY